MVHRYSDWDKQRYKTGRSIPWWMKNFHVVQKIAWGTIFIWAFGGIYKMLLFPSEQFMIRSLDPRHSEDGTRFMQLITKREKSLFEKRTPKEQEKDDQKS